MPKFPPADQRMPSQRESKPDRMARADACEKELVQKAHQQWARDAIRDRKAAEAHERRLMVQLKREKLIQHPRARR